MEFPRPRRGGGGDTTHILSKTGFFVVSYGQLTRAKTLLTIIKAITILSLQKYSPFNKDITTLLSCQYVGFLKWHVFSVPDDHPQLITKVNMN